jgi:addiction module HigA family antidote
LSVPARRINEIVHGTRAVSADTALRLARFFSTSELFWLNLQAHYDLDIERDRLGARLEREVAVLRRAS